uniref:hypothetical protein n=1 Tax=Streptomyces corallincola TaxID=2851888 RepID=UPI001FE3758B|nr:hypothetical protein [Streptomyces corallincola]
MTEQPEYHGDRGGTQGWGPAAQPAPPAQPPAGPPGYGHPAPPAPQAPGYGFPHQQGGGAPVPSPYAYPAQPVTPPMGTPVGPPAPHLPLMGAQPMGQFPGGGPQLAIGDITVVGDRIITPSGTMPLRGAMWNATDMSHTEEKIPAHAIVLAIVFFVFCLLGLLFLLMKERKTVGYVQVTVTSGGRHHAAMIPAFGPQTFPAVLAQVNHARSLSV